MKRSRLRGLLELAAGVLSHLLDRLLASGAFAFHPAPPARHRAVLVRLDAIGDFILWLAAARSLTQELRNQGAEIVLLANAAWADWAETLDIADEVWALDAKRFRRNLVYRALWLRKLAGARFDIAIHPAPTRVFRLGDAIVNATRANERLGFSAAKRDHLALRLLSEHWYTRRIDAPEPEWPELLTNARFVSQLFHNDFKPALADLSAEKSACAVSAVLCPSASWNGKRWPRRHFIELGKRLVQAGRQVLVVGAITDNSLLQGIAESIGTNARPIACRDLSDLLTLCREAAIVISNDSAALHLAAAAGARTVCVAGGGHPGRFVPYPESVGLPGPRPVVVTKPMQCFGCGWTCIYPPALDGAMRCLSDISVDEVWSQTEPLLAHF